MLIALGAAARVASVAPTGLSCGLSACPLPNPGPKNCAAAMRLWLSHRVIASATDKIRAMPQYTSGATEAELDLSLLRLSEDSEVERDAAGELA